jgi:hypothetical protein
MLFKNEILDNEIKSIHSKQYANEILCNTNKEERFPCANKTKTRGILLATYNCGIIVSYRELFGSESITQVVLFYLDLISICQKLPEYYIYEVFFFLLDLFLDLFELKWLFEYKIR